MKGLCAVEMITFITNDQLLLKMRGNFWTIIDTNGQIKEIPRKLLNVLKRTIYTSIQSQVIYDKNKTMLVLTSDELISTVFFDHRGQMTNHYNYQIDISDENEKAANSISVLSDSKGRLYRFYNCE